MEEEFVEIEVEDSSLYEDHEIDVDYEFDAPRFCDFTRPETFWDACEAEQWFEFAQSYPPSPFLMKFRWGNAGAMENVNVVGDNYVPCVEAEQVSAIEDNNSKGLEYCNNQTIQDTLDGKTKALSKSSSLKSKVFTFMKPTASHLAKLKNPPEVQTSRRVQEKNSLSIDCQLTKRQKLEAGYLRKVARLKHQTLFAHKKTKEVNHIDVNLASKPNVTVPREPNLQTALRAQRHKSRTNAESGEHTKSSSQVIKPRPLNKKSWQILEAPTELDSLKSRRCGSRPLDEDRTTHIPSYILKPACEDIIQVVHSSSNGLDCVTAYFPWLQEIRSRGRHNLSLK